MSNDLTPRLDSFILSRVYIITLVATESDSSSKAPLPSGCCLLVHTSRASCGVSLSSSPRRFTGKSSLLGASSAGLFASHCSFTFNVSTGLRFLGSTCCGFFVVSVSLFVTSGATFRLPRLRDDALVGPATSLTTLPPAMSWVRVTPSSSVKVLSTTSSLNKSDLLKALMRFSVFGFVSSALTVVSRSVSA